MESTALRLIFANEVFHKRAVLLIFEIEYKARVLEIVSYPDTSMGQIWLVDPEKNFQNQGSQKT